MMDWLLAGLLVAAAGGVIYYWRWAAIQERIQNRLDDAQTERDLSRGAERPFARRHYWIAWLVAVAVGMLLVLVLSWPINIAVGLALSVALMGLEVDAWIYEWRQSRVETQLADALDVVVASLSSGASLQRSLADAAEYSPQPLKKELQVTVARLNLGNSPQEVFISLSRRIPTETFQLLATALIVNWEVGGGLAETLAGLGRTVRDRIAISRQVRTLSTQGRLTTVTVIIVVWFMAAMMWQAEPGRFVGFVNSLTGSWLITICLLLQGLGIALVSRISRPKI